MRTCERHKFARHDPVEVAILHLLKVPGDASGERGIQRGWGRRWPPAFARIGNPTLLLSLVFFNVERVKVRELEVASLGNPTNAVIAAKRK